jgi:hypothetical protein
MKLGSIRLSVPGAADGRHLIAAGQPVYRGSLRWDEHTADK